LGFLFHLFFLHRIFEELIRVLFRDLKFLICSILFNPLELVNTPTSFNLGNPLTFALGSVPLTERCLILVSPECLFM
ncbi:hypothetical protein PMAYCL1PPCAC_05028, partial [Pristionchus mayeri]